MRHRLILGAVLSAMAVSFGGTEAHAQAMLADDIVILSKGQREQEKAKTNTHLGPSPGTGERPFKASPGAGEARLGEQPGGSRAPVSMQQRDVLSAASAEGRSFGQAGAARIAPLPTTPSQKVPIYGPLDLPAGDDEGPPDGLTLDMAIERLKQANFGSRRSSRRFRRPRRTSSRPGSGQTRSSSRARMAFPMGATPKSGRGRTAIASSSSSPWT